MYSVYEAWRSSMPITITVIITQFTAAKTCYKYQLSIAFGGYAL